jgi:hydrogenase maturation protein HypF
MEVRAPTRTGSDAPARYRVRVRGVVQGVGFRPFVHRLASDLSLGGLVGNDTEGVFLEVEGTEMALAEFDSRLLADKPPMARIETVEWTAMSPNGDRSFRIAESESSRAVSTYVSPDVCVCNDCMAEMSDPADRRYRYPFINCTNCGPRFTITERLPYDRPGTTMRGFTMCPACAAEYGDPADRRYHAQPIACPDCGPRVWYDDGRAETGGTDPAILAAQRDLAAGALIAVKGLGGYHLACDARDGSAVAALRRRKNRPHKPFAVMVRDLGLARDIAQVDEFESALITGPARPIVLLRRKGAGPMSPGVAPDNPLLGVFLPYTPLHHLLFAPVPGSGLAPPDLLVMTSGNLSDEPICYEDRDARHRLGGIADGWLLHDRPIHVPCDDSVVRASSGRELPLRRSRGYAPLPLTLPFESDPILAVGGEIKNTFCLAKGRVAWMGQHIGDMGRVETLDAFEHSTEQFSRFYQVGPKQVAADCHPGYHTRQWADDRGPAPVTIVQHHHAHVAAVMAEHQIDADQTVIGFAFDGTGYGRDGAIWGGEVLRARYCGFDRSRHLRYIPLPGGDAAVRKPYRVALAHLWAAGIDWTLDLPPAAEASPAEMVVIRHQLEGRLPCVPTSSMGRLFDAVSSLLGIRQVATYEAQAAIELEGAAVEGRTLDTPSYTFAVEGPDFDPGPVVRGLVRDLRAGESRRAMATGFHIAVADLIAELARRERQETGINVVALTGGVFQNVLLADLACRKLDTDGFEVLTHRLVPPNDGGLALGQVAVAAASRTCCDGSGGRE